MKQFKLNIFRKIKIFVFHSHPPFTRLTKKYCTPNSPRSVAHNRAEEDGDWHACWIFVE